MAANSHPGQKTIKVLALSDEVDQRIYSEYLVDNFSDVELLISCGDLSFYYLEYLIDVLNVPMFFVHGNHDPEIEVGHAGERRQPWGAENLDGRVVWHRGLILAGFEGSIRYSNARHQYTQREMWLKVLRTVPRLWFHKLRYGRFLDVLVTHAPAWDVSDRPDMVHRGFKAFRWLLEVFKPRYHFHGHIHQFDHSRFRSTKFNQTEIINAHSYKRVEIVVETQSDEYIEQIEN
jgi:Icc-related predicted phosphoesterase